MANASRGRRSRRCCELLMEIVAEEVIHIVESSSHWGGKVVILDDLGRGPPAVPGILRGGFLLVLVVRNKFIIAVDIGIGAFLSLPRVIPPHCPVVVEVGVSRIGGIGDQIRRVAGG